MTTVAGDHAPCDWSVLIPAAGRGERMGLGPKLLLTLDGETLWERSLGQVKGFGKETILAVPSELVPAIQAVARNARVVPGGATRHASIVNALLASRGEMIMIHDVARPFANRELLHAVAEAAMTFGAAACQTRLDGPLASVHQSQLTQIDSTVGERVILHSPLACRRDMLVRALESSDTRSISSTAALLHHAGFAVHLVENRRENFKITYPADLQLARLLTTVWKDRASDDQHLD